MKTRLMKLLFMIAVFFTVSIAASAQVYVKVRPTYKTVERPRQPRQGYVWVDEDWKARGRNYRYSGGHWVKPPHRGDNWTPGHWETTRRGDVWVQGSWRRS
jgi:hypothetical protein